MRAEIEAYLKRWISSFGPPLVEGVRATRLRACGGGFEVRITRGTVTAEQVVIATGPSWARSAVVLGPVPDPDLPALVAGADAFAFPSAKEGFGLAAMEPLAAGVSPVVSDLPVLRQVFAGAVAFADGPAAFAEVLADALDRPDPARAAAGRPLAAWHTWAEAARRHLVLHGGVQE